MGDLPSGFREQSEVDLGTGQARAFDDQVTRALLLDEETRARAAGMLNPLGYANAAQQGYSSILGNQQPSPWAGILGGALGGLAGAFL